MPPAEEEEDKRERDPFPTCLQHPKLHPSAQHPVLCPTPQHPTLHPTPQHPTLHPTPQHPGTPQTAPGVKLPKEPERPNQERQGTRGDCPSVPPTARIDLD